MSSLVMVRYMRLLTSCLYFVASSNAFPSIDFNFKFYSIRVERGLQSIMPNLFNNSLIYFLWEMKMYFRFSVTSMPK